MASNHRSSGLSVLAGKSAVTTVTADDEALRDHLVHGVPVLPGVFLLDLVLRLVRRAGVDPATVELRRCLFLAPVIDRDHTGRRVRVRVGDDGVHVTVDSRAPEEDEWQVNCRAELHPAAPLSRTIDIGALTAASTSSCDVGELYEFVRGLDIHHKGFMKASGTVYVGAGHALARMRLPGEAEPYLEHFQVHPVLLDFATLVPMWLFDPEERARAGRPFIPIYIESFRAAGRPSVGNVVHVPRRAAGRLDGEVFDADIDVHSLDGTAVASMTGFRAKRIRSAELITRPHDDSGHEHTESNETGRAPSTLTGIVAGLVAVKLGIPAAEVDPDRGFYELGLDSVRLLAIAAALEERLGTQLYPTLLFEFPTVRALADHLAGEGLQPAPESRPVFATAASDAGFALAVVGLAGRYPGADTPGALWNVLLDGPDLITGLPAERAGKGSADGHRGAFCSGVDEFDPEFFHLTDRQAQLMDPHERLFLQAAWEAVEDAGHTPGDLSARLDGAVGVFAGVMWNDYMLHGLDSLHGATPEVAGSWTSSLANRVSYTLDFQGPSLTVDTACSAALVALHLARESIRRGECRAAVVGGVNLSLHPYKFLRLSELGLLSPDGRCRPFGKDANGYVPGEGVGAVLVRPLADALADGDHIYGVIRGSAMGHGGRTGGYSVPSPEAQVRVLTSALADAGVPPETVTHLEAHASCTPLGDRIELDALASAYGSAARGSCVLGSVKGSIGHLEAAAGVAGLTTMLLSFRHKTIPPTQGVGEVNPALADTPFRIVDRPTPFGRVTDPVTGAPSPRRGAVSAFGAGGANVHIVLEEHVAAPRPEDSGARLALPLSARTDEQLRAVAARLAAHLRDQPSTRVADVAHTLRHGRTPMRRRAVVTAADRTELVAALDVVAAGGTPDGALRPEGGVWLDGRAPTWPELPHAQRIPLPTYPFARRRFWIGRDSEERGDTFLYEPRWTSVSPADHVHFADRTVLVLDADDDRVSALRVLCGRVIQVRPGHLRGVLETLREERAELDAVLHLWQLGPADQEPAGTGGLESMLDLCRELVVGRTRELPVLFAYTAGHENPALAAVGGLARSVRLEQPKLACTVARYTVAPTAAELLAEASDVDSVEVRHTTSGRQVLGFSPVDPAPVPVPVARAGGVYLITGGAGGLGRHTARLLALQHGVSIALLGRAAPGAATDRVIDELEALGARAIYRTADVTDLARLTACVADVVDELGPLTGVVHSAGVIDDALLLNKTPDRIARVLAPKVLGAANLDLATRDAHLDYLVVYSSTASVLGSAGATDYASANRYLDAFAARREELRGDGLRHGRTVAINWPLWRDGGMRIPPEVEELVLGQTGMRPLETGAGLAVLGVALAHDAAQLVVLSGDRAQLEQRMSLASDDDRQPPDVAQPDLAAATEYVSRLVRNAVNGHGAPAHVDDLRGATFMELGLSSAQLVAMTEALKSDLALDLPPTVLFRYPDVDRLAGYLVREQPVALAAHTSAPGIETVADTRGDARPEGPTPIAIIGMAGRFPGSSNVDGFWADLVAGRDLVTPVPGERWDHSQFHDAGGGRPGGTDCGHGGFLDDVARFDAAFFGVTPAEARGMDPQLRLLLEVLYETTEDAGVARSVRGTPTGTYVGRCFQDYADEMAAHGRAPAAYDVTGTAVAMAANRVAHYFDFSGPSLVVDTACSSSLYALHLAVEALRRGECTMAFAAGTNLILSPQHYVRSSALGALSPSGRCHSFDHRADGYVPGEAVVAVLLKPLDDAIADGDPVHAVIRDVTVSHGGHAGSLTAPNPERQTDLLVRAWEGAGVDPASITYLEAHGTGTSLGDPVEVEAATAAFRRFTDRTGFCALGSAKAHLGHAEAAAGLVSVVKAVLSMRHRTIPAMPGFERPNPYCQFTDSPMWINTENVPWQSEGVRRAGVSSFGFGGAYAHAVLEEAPTLPAGHTATGHAAVPFSAGDDNRLVALVRRHREHLVAHPELPLARVAATLSAGREPMARRLAVIAASTDELSRRLGEVLDTSVVGTVLGDTAGVDPALVREARDWVAGDSGALSTPWAERLSLPGYPFRGERFWFTDGHSTVEPTVGFSGRRVAAGMDRLDGLIRRWCHRFLAAGAGTPAAADLRGRLAEPARYERFADALGDLLTRATTSAAERPGLDAELTALVGDHPELKSWAGLVRVCLPKLPAILTGEADALEVYFSPEDPDLLLRVYSDSIIADHHNELVARAVADRVRNTGRSVRILEIGGGTGGTTRSVLAALAGDAARVGYTFTDVSPSFLPTARVTFADAPVRLDYRVLDLDQDLASQGFPDGSADIVIAANAVHATRSIADSLGRIGRLLADGGVLILQELTSARDSITAMIGALPGYWSAADAPRRLPHSPLLDVPRWRAALAEQSFGQTDVSGSTDLNEAEFDNAVIVSAAPAGPRVAAEAPPVTVTAAVAAGADSVRERLRAVFADFFGLPVAGVDPHATFDRFGMDSLSSIQLARSLEPEFGTLSKVVLYEYPTIDELATHIADRQSPAPAPAPAPASPPEPEGDPIAIVGMAGRFARSRTLTRWWTHLRDGADLVTEIPADRFDWRDVYGDPTRDRGTVNSRWGSFCDGVDEFDAAFFGVTPFEAELMDPQQRLLLQTAWHAIEDAGHRPQDLRGSRTGVFVGATSRDYDWHLQSVGRHREGHFVTGSGHCLIANRLSYHLDLRGPSEAIDTACSSSLTALHRGVGSIQTGECDAAVVGGVHLFLTPDLFVALGQLGVMSPDGRCAAFDASANGMVRGEGAVAVVLKPLSRAVADGDTIHALVRGTGVSHGGGRHASSLMMPEPAAQADLIASVYRSAGADPRSITYVEAHGTGTQVGDPIELRGLRLAFAELTGAREGDAVRPWCGVGSVKSNVGHLESAAGLTGVVKTVLAMRHGQLPPTVHFREPNPLLELVDSPFYVVDRLTQWVSPSGPRRAAVSAFGLGGTNAHVLLEEYLQPPSTSTTAGPQVVPLSARSPERLRTYAAELRRHLVADPATSFTDLVHTLRVGRDAMTHRLALVAESTGELADLLGQYLDGTAAAAIHAGTVSGPALGGLPVITDPATCARGWVIGHGELPPPDSTRARRIPLPGYPFAPTRHWAEPPATESVESLLDRLSKGDVSVDEVDRILGGVR